MQSPEQFLREFAEEMRTSNAAERQLAIRSWAKLLRLREEAARLDELMGCKDFQENMRMPVEIGLKPYIAGRITKLTTPNNTTNTLEEKP